MTDVPGPGTLCEMFERQAQACPERIAIHSQGRDLTYGALADQAARIAAWLSARGMPRGDRVAMILPNSPEYVSWYLGILRAGGIAVALNPETTPAELAATLSHSAPFAVVSGTKTSSVLSEALGRLGTAQPGLSGAPFSGPKFLVRVEDSGRNPPPANCHVALHSDILKEISDPLAGWPVLNDLAQLIYTSGTTGRPKAVTLSHRNISANCRSILGYLALTRDDSAFVTLPFFYSYGNSLLVTHMAVGGRLILADNFVFWNSALDLMEQQQATGFAGVPASYAMLLHKSDFRKRRFAALRYLTCAGGGLAPAVVEQLRSAVPHVKLFLMYGQTEATARLSTLMPDELDAKPGSIGRGIPGVALDVRDDIGAPVPCGEVGEIVARGENIMAGYWNDPQETATVLRPEGLRTGDLARMDEDGYLYIVGRKSDIIKSGAYRINPKEIEEVILSLKPVAEVAVVGLPDEIWGEAPVAFVVASAGAGSIDEGQIIEHCRQNLPRYKLVREVRFVETLPRTASGKIRRTFLREQAPSIH
ncbi:MAG TPA: class I adenylate-forming enzyme family protein [Planctomycetaceae bacterium]|nr:class I adenylate-forming enzyme family protein [Planctomycetaceae bacterium]